jgi:periplasmic copper chaperone A
MKMRHLCVMLATSVLSVADLHAGQADHVTASHAWIRLLPANLPASGYVTLQNTGPSAATLVSAHSAAYASVMLHESTSGSNGMSSMHAVDQLAIPAQGKAALAPAGFHLMLEQASHMIKAGDTVNITLDFADGSQLPVHFLVRPANAADPE